MEAIFTSMETTRKEWVFDEGLTVEHKEGSARDGEQQTASNSSEKRRRQKKRKEVDPLDAVA
jgi:hypothetical protein